MEKATSRLVQIQSICRQYNECKLNAEIPFGMSSKHCRKRRKYWLSAFSHFPTMFSKGFFFRVIKSQDKKLTHLCDALNKASHRIIVDP